MSKAGGNIEKHGSGSEKACRTRQMHTTKLFQSDPSLALGSEMQTHAQDVLKTGLIMGLCGEVEMIRRGGRARNSSRALRIYYFCPEGSVTAVKLTCLCAIARVAPFLASPVLVSPLVSSKLSGVGVRCKFDLVRCLPFSSRALLSLSER